MIALYIILGILLLLFLLMLIRVQIFFKYSKTPNLTIKVLFFKKTLLPSEPKKKKTKKKKKKPAKKPEPKPQPRPEKKDKEEKKSYLGKLKEKKGLSGLMSLFTGLAKIATGALKGLFSHIVVHKLDIGIQLSSGDAASTAINYGRLCSALYPAVDIITAATVCKSYNVSVEPVFDDDKETEYYADVHAHLRVIFAVGEAIKAGIRLLLLRMKL